MWRETAESSPYSYWFISINDQCMAGINILTYMFWLNQTMLIPNWFNIFVCAKEKNVAQCNSLHSKSPCSLWSQYTVLETQEQADFPKYYFGIFYLYIILYYTRSLGALRASTSSWSPFGPLDFVLRALLALRPCSPRVGVWIAY